MLRKRFFSAMKIHVYLLTFSFLQMIVDGQVTISADKSLPRDGETVNLICSIPSFKVPASWSVNGSGAFVSLTNCPPSGPCQPSNDAARYTYSATASSIGATITSFKSTVDTIGWKCDYGTTSAVYVIKPAVPVTTVQLTNTLGETLTSTINIVRRGSTDIRCSTAPHGSRPRATFHWYNRPVNQSPVLIGNQYISSTPNPITVPGQPESDLLISYSTLTQTGDPLYQNVHIFCEARDETSTGNYKQSGEVQLNIVYPPLVQLSPNYSVYNVTEGTQNFVFTCNIIETNPLPQSNGYSWLHNSLVIQGQTSSSYTLPSVRKSDDGEYKCTAKNDYGSGTSNSLALNVQYPPLIQGLTSPYKVIEYQTLNVTCQVSSNPLPDHISWSPTGESSVPSSLYFRSVSRNNSGTYNCTAQNTMTPTVGGQQTGFNTSQIQVDVLYPPSIQGLVSPYKVIENQSLNVTCKASSNPLPNHISWSPIGESSVPSTLYLSSVSRNKSGTYTCIAQNIMIPSVGGQQTGMNTSQIQVDVLSHNATTAPSVLQRSDVECQTTSLKIFVPKNLVPGNGTVTWRDSACVVHSNGTHFVDTVGLRDCGTTLTLEADYVVFENDLILHKNGTQTQNGNNLVTYGSDYEFAIPVKCVYPRNSNISTSYIPIVQQVRIIERRNGQLDLSMRQYEAEDYSQPVPFNAYPRQVPLNNDIFIRLAMENNVTGLGLSADNCFATSTPSPVDQNWYQLISSGCPVNNAKIHPSGVNDVKFSFHAFNFHHNTSGIVYVHCQVSVCLDTDPACVVGCVTRKKRSASSREGAITSNLISTGPFILTADESGVAMSTVIAAVSIAVAVIATVVAIIGWTRKSKKGADS